MNAAGSICSVLGYLDPWVCISPVLKVTIPRVPMLMLPIRFLDRWGPGLLLAASASVRSLVVSGRPPSSQKPPVHVHSSRAA